MEGVGARLGRSSTRYGPATVFTGPVRKWKKKWVHVSPSANSSSNSNHNNTNHNHSSNNNNGNNGSHLLLYKWTPITQSQNNSNVNGTGSVKDAPLDVVEEPPRRKFKYIPVAVLEEQKNEATENDEAAEKVEDESNPIEPDSTAAEPTTKNETLDEKPDINDVPMEETEPQGKSQVVRQDLNESTLDLSLGLTSHDEDQDEDSKTNQTRDGQ